MCLWRLGLQQEEGRHWLLGAGLALGKSTSSRLHRSALGGACVLAPWAQDRRRSWRGHRPLSPAKP